MPKIRFGSTTVDCDAGDNLRKVLMRNGLSLYNGVAAAIHCRGMGTCGTCAVQVSGDVTPPTKVERWRLSFPPHKSESGLRLACQCKVMGDLEIQKHGGMWGHRIGEGSQS